MTISDKVAWAALEDKKYDLSGHREGEFLGKRGLSQSLGDTRLTRLVFGSSHVEADPSCCPEKGSS